MRVGGVAVLAVFLGAASPPPGASSCSGCHGGVAPLPVLTGGRDGGEIVTVMDAFRTGTRPATVMDRIAKGFSHDETLAIATWWAEQK